jgi:hypothetical protein
MPAFCQNPQIHSRWPRFFATLASAAVLLIGLDVADRVHTRSQLQQLAENAALAGVQAMQDSAGQDETQRREIAAAASRAVTDTIGTANATVTTSVAPIYVSVELSQTSGWLSRINGHLDVVGKAGYLPPSQSEDGQQVRLYNRLEGKILTARAG